MINVDPVVCPQCKVGFAPGTVLCPICKITLISGGDAGQVPAPVVLSDDLWTLEELRTASSGWIRHLQDRLAQAEIPHRTELSDRREMLFSIYVRPADLTRAKDIDEKVFALEVPEGERMPRPETLDFSICPGCGNRLGERDRECSSCGLVLFPTEGWKCGNCNGAVAVDVTVCPHCGGGIDWTKA